MSGKACCAMARRLAGRLAALDLELRKGAHLGYAKLATQYGQPASSIERHKKVCLGLGRAPKATVPTPDPAVAPVIVVAPKPSKEASKNGGGKSLDAQEQVAGAGAREPPNLAESRAHKVAWILREMILGRWTEDNERAGVRELAERWKLQTSTVEEYARSARDSLAISAASVAEVRAYSAHWHETIRDKALDGEEPDLRTAAQAQNNFDRALGVVGDSKQVTINIVQHPAFVAMVDAALDALRPFPQARAAVVGAWQQAAKELQQPEPTVLLTTGEEMPG